ncbi:hypothetical protein HDK64DRAFT_312998 [Phyllosticta capitalensis]
MLSVISNESAYALEWELEIARQERDERELTIVELRSKLHGPYLALEFYMFAENTRFERQEIAIIRSKEQKRSAERTKQGAIGLDDVQVYVSESGQMSSMPPSTLNLVSAQSFGLTEHELGNILLPSMD